MSHPIRVLELRSVAGVGGGPDKTILATAARPNTHVAVTVCYLCNEGDRLFPIGQQAAAMGIDYVEVRERHSLDSRVWQELRRIVQTRKINIVHGHEYKTDLLAFLLSKREPVIPFATAHGWTGHSLRERYVYYPGDKRLLSRFPRVAAVSGEIRNALVAAGGDSQRIDVVLNGIDPTRFKRDPSRRLEARTTYDLSDDVVVMGAVGRLEPQKRFDLLIEAFSRLSPERPNLRLLIAGEGSLRTALQKQIESLGLDRSVRLVGHSDVTTFHHAIDLFVQSSDYEGTPNVVLEAMALETPIVATDVGGTSELIDNNVHGLVIPAGDVAALCDALRLALEPGTASRARTAAARRRVETDLSFNERMRKIESIYEQLFDHATKSLSRSALT